MRAFFAVHPGEFLVGDYVTRRLGRKYDVWVPAKDTGIDLLLTPRGKSSRAIKLQVKFSRSYDVVRPITVILLPLGGTPSIRKIDEKYGRLLDFCDCRFS